MRQVASVWQGETVEPVDRRRLDRTPLGSQLADVVRNDILFGRFRPGQQISQQMLCDRYGTSRMPVRDALRQLTYEGFIVDDGSHHAAVASFSRADLQDIYLIEGMLHALAARRVTERGDPQEIEEIVGYHEQMVEAGEAEDAQRMVKVNWSFHRRINQLADSPKLIAVLRTHSYSIPRDYILEVPGWVQRANQQHADIVDAIRALRAGTAERLMKQHVVDAGNDLISFLGAQRRQAVHDTDG